MGVFDKKLNEALVDGEDMSSQQRYDYVTEESYAEKRRTPHESEEELIAPYVTSMGYKAQYSTILDDEGNVIEVPWGTKGSRRPDGFNTETYNVVEVKNYDVSTCQGKNRLANNIRKQTNASLKQYGDVEIVNVIDLKGQNVTIEDMEKLTDKLEEKCPEVDLDYRW